jgi:hypothetical protein
MEQAKTEHMTSELNQSDGKPATAGPATDFAKRNYSGSRIRIYFLEPIVLKEKK